MGFRFAKDGVVQYKEAVQALEDAGLSKSQASSVGVGKILEILGEDNEVGIGVLHAATKDLSRKISYLERLVDKQIDELEQKSNAVETLVETLSAFQNYEDKLTDDRAKNAMALYAGLIQFTMSQCLEDVSSVEQIIKTAGSVVVSYLGDDKEEIR